jgi:pyridoxal phosphate enzyme (YggS family)
MAQLPATNPSPLSPNHIARNLAAVRQTIASAARAANRDANDIRLIAVSKTMSVSAVEAAVRAGQLEFGENTIQDARTKIPQFEGHGLTWHFIGHLQTNKVKFVPGQFAWVHSIDRLDLAVKLSRHAQRTGKPINGLIQVNVTGESSKHGTAPRDLFALVEQILEAELAGIVLRGLMTLGAYTANESELQDGFAQLRKLRDDCTERFGLKGFTELSMGMTNDYPIAIAEGATLVRIGTAIFGERTNK